VVRDVIIEDGATIETSLLEHSIIGRGASVRGKTSKLNVGDLSTAEL
jgi:hypothetical protein